MLEWRLIALWLTGVDADRFMRQGAQALVVPFMDVTDWGEHQHNLHARVSSLRAQEYQIPIFRVGSSGVSQLVDSLGRINITAPFPGPEQIIGGTLILAKAARLPVDAIVAPACVVTAIGIVIILFYRTLLRKGPLPIFRDCTSV